MHQLGIYNMFQHFNSINANGWYFLVKLLSIMLLVESIVSTHALHHKKDTHHEPKEHVHKNVHKNESSPAAPKPIRSRKMELSEIEINCTDTTGSFEDGKTCLNGSVPPSVIDLALKPEHIEKTALWYSADNAEHIKNVRKVEEACSNSCKSGTCFYSLKQLDYICGSSSSDAFNEAQLAWYQIQLAHFNSLLYAAGIICWTGQLNGKVFDPFKTNIADLELAKWYVRKFPEKNQTELERTLSKQCRSKQCEFSSQKAAFVCAEHGTSHKMKMYPFSLAVLFVLEVGLLLCNPVSYLF